MKKYFIFGLLLLSAVLVFGGCAKKELSKEEARSILSKNPPGKLTRSISKHPQVQAIGANDKVILEKLQEAGYVSVKEVSGKEAKGAGDYYEVTATSRLSPFVVSEDADNINVKLADLVIDQVTEVVMKENEADAAYTTRLELTPVAEAYAPVRNPSPGPNHASFRWVDGKWK